LVIGMICNLFPHTAPDIALDALRYLVSENTQELERRSLRLAIFGDGPMRSALERFVKVWGLEDWVRLFGFRVDLADILPGLDAILTTSLREMMPVSLLEAMNAGVAIIGAPHNGTLDLVADGVTGIVLKGWGPHHLAAALIDERVNKTWLRAAGSAGRARLMEHFDIRAVAKAYLALYRRACTNVLRCNYYG
jgi:glycosyltransferase involved in cell wall biosynthesis